MIFSINSSNSRGWEVGVENMVTQKQLMRIWVHLLVECPSPTQLKKDFVFKLLGLNPGEMGSILVFSAFLVRLWRDHLYI